MNLDEFQRRMSAAPRALERAHLEAAQRAADACVVVWNAKAAQAGLSPGAPLPRHTGKPWAGARSEVVTKSGKPQVKVGLQRPAALVFGPKPTVKHYIGAKGLGTRGGIAKRMAGRDLSRALTGNDVAAGLSSTRSGKRALSFGGGHPVSVVPHPGSRRKNIKPVLNAEASRVTPPVFSRANVSTLRAIGLGH